MQEWRRDHLTQSNVYHNCRAAADHGLRTASHQHTVGFSTTLSRSRAWVNGRWSSSTAATAKKCAAGPAAPLPQLREAAAQKADAPRLQISLAQPLPSSFPAGGAHFCFIFFLITFQFHVRVLDRVALRPVQQTLEQSGQQPRGARAVNALPAGRSKWLVRQSAPSRQVVLQAAHSCEQ